jgi:ABC-2 type transport system ATP-binding protein
VTTVKVAHLTRSFGSVRALRDVSFEIPSGIIFGLLGPSGSGKTTLIRIIAGALGPTDGTIEVLGLTLPHRDAAARTGYMTQSAALYPDLSLRENLEFFGTLYGIPRSELSRRIVDIAEAIELRDRLDDQLLTFSGGMLQRSSLASALLHDPDLLLLYEPTVGLDPVLRRTFWSRFRDLAGRGKTLIVSSHIMDEADRCDLLGFIRDGELLVTAAPDEIRRMTGQSNLEDAFLELARARSSGGQAARQEAA